MGRARLRVRADERAITSAAPRKPIPRPALVLGWAGMIPLAAASVLIWVLARPLPALVLVLQMQYAAIVLSFLGAVHWGLALAEYRGGVADGEKGVYEGAGWGRYGWGLVLAFLGWLAIQLPPAAALLLLIVALAAAWLGDVVVARRGLMPRWYTRLRKPLTLVAILCMVASLLGLGKVLPVVPGP